MFPSDNIEYHAFSSDIELTPSDKKLAKQWEGNSENKTFEKNNSTKTRPSI